jgi:hypothetical protein
MITTPQILRTEAQAAAVIRLTVPRSEMRKVFGPAVGELMAALAEQGVKPVGAVFAHHLKMSPDTFDFDADSDEVARLFRLQRAHDSDFNPRTIPRYSRPLSGPC